MNDEQVFLADGNLKVTNARFVVDDKTYAMSGITSVHAKTKPASTGGFAVLLAVGLLVILSAFTSDGTMSMVSRILLVGVGVFMVGVAAIMSKGAQPTYQVILRTSDGEITAYESKDKDHIHDLIRALNDSIVARG